MNEFDNYYFIYKNSMGTWDEAKNPVFIASHTHCRAILKSQVKNIRYLISKLNSINTNMVTEYLKEKHCLY